MSECNNILSKHKNEQVMKLKELYRAILVLSIISIVGFGCDEIFEDDLSEATVYVLAPSNGLTTNLLTHTFWWEPVEDARGYNLTIVSPSFDNIEKLIVDTNITGTKFNYTLYPDTFEWSIRAYNGSTTTDYFFYTLIIEQTNDLTEQMVVLRSPANNTTTNVDSIVFQWYALPGAEYYMIEIKTPDWDGSPAIVPEVVYGTSFTLTDLEDGDYHWGIRAYNSTSSSIASPWALSLDTQNPADPTLVYPAYNQTINDTSLTDSKIVFQWSRAVDTGTSITDSIYISPDSLFTTSQKYSTTETSIEHIMITAGDYWWKVISRDKAGNKSGYAIGKFIFEID